jgi:hypothetical protein
VGTDSGLPVLEENLEKQTWHRANLRVKTRKGQQIEVFLKMLLG